MMLEAQLLNLMLAAQVIKDLGSRKNSAIVLIASLPMFSELTKLLGSLVMLFKLFAA